MGLVDGIINGFTGLVDTAVNANIASQNLNLQRDNLNYQKDLQKQIFAREDNAVQRRAQDLEAAGLSKTLAAGSAANAGSVVGTTAPQNQFKSNFQGIVGQMANYMSTMEDVKRKQIENSVAQHDAEILTGNDGVVSNIGRSTDYAIANGISMLMFNKPITELSGEASKWVQKTLGLEPVEDAKKAAKSAGQAVLDTYHNAKGAVYAERNHNFAYDPSPRRGTVDLGPVSVNLPTPLWYATHEQSKGGWSPTIGKFINPAIQSQVAFNTNLKKGSSDYVTDQFIKKNNLTQKQIDEILAIKERLQNKYDRFVY